MANYVVYRGQHGTTEAKIQTRLASISFGTLNAAKIYSTMPNRRDDVAVAPTVLSATISIENPIVDNKYDRFIDFNLLVDRFGYEFIWHMAEKFSDYIYNMCAWEDNFFQYSSIAELKEKIPSAVVDLYLDAYLLLDDEEFVGKAKELGYDGAIHMGNGKTRNEFEYRIFFENQIQNLKKVEGGLTKSSAF